jgi:hypothetical protein
MEEQYWQEWIEQYLFGSISPENKSRLEQLMATDPAIADEVRQSREAFSVLQFERNRLLKQKLKEIDNEKPKRFGFLPVWIMPLVVVLMLLTSGWYWVSSFYSPSSVALRFFETGQHIGPSLIPNAEAAEHWKMGIDAFRKKEYEKAIQLFTTTLSVSQSQAEYETKWNILLAHLAKEGATIQWEEMAKAFSTEAPEPWSSKSRQLIRLFNSPLYNLFFTGIHTPLSSLKPKII